MTKKEPLLSICIPTYNREKYLKGLLDSIVCQKEFTDTHDVEIVVDDGPSTDNTELIVKDYIKKYGDKIKYYRNPKKIGMCPAFLEALSLGLGKYLRLFGSDDVMCPKGLSIVLEIIRFKKPSLIFPNTVQLGDDNKMGDNIENKIFYGFEDFSIWLGECDSSYSHKMSIFTFISIFCVRKDFFAKNLSKLKTTNKKFDINHNYFNFSIVGFYSCYHSDLIDVIESPVLVYGTPNNTSWTPNYKIVKDLHWMFRFLKNKYNLTKMTNDFLNGLLFNIFIQCAIIPWSKKFGIYRFLKYFWGKILKIIK